MRKVSEEEFKKVIKSGKFVVDFYADWCGPCKMLAPNLQELERELEASGVEILKVNVDEAPDLSEEMGIQFIPYVVTFADGEKKDAFNGYKSTEDLREFIKNSMAI